MPCLFWPSEAAARLPSPSPPPVQPLALNTGTETTSRAHRVITEDGHEEGHNVENRVEIKFIYTNRENVELHCA